jgi:hypothetical protein
MVDRPRELMTPIDDVHEHLQIGLHLSPASGCRTGEHRAVGSLDHVAVQRVHRALAAHEAIGL